VEGGEGEWTASAYQQRDIRDARTELRIESAKARNVALVQQLHAVRHVPPQRHSTRPER
jgi:hypothetical protein